MTFFTNIGSDLDKEIPHTQKNFGNFLQGVFNESLYLNPTTKKEIISIICSIKCKPMCSGFDELPSLLIKRIAHSISDPLSFIINLSLETGIVPDKLKIAKVVPLFKSGEASVFSNYRPVSILPIFSKIYEKVIYTRILNFFNKHNILYNKQFGFRSKHSTSLALIDLIDKISQAIDNNEFTIGIFLDLSKAFDTVNHNILLKKMEFYGVRGLPLSWMQSYLQNRYQYIDFQGTISDYLPISCGVPQGSILGPLLFLIYVNDLPNSSTILKSILFADDTNLFLSDRDFSVLLNTANDELTKVSEWLYANRFSMNVKKNTFLSFFLT